mgnify:CR=1 FL=1
MTFSERTQPQNEGFERAVLGACLMSAESVAQAVEALRPADFYRPAHGRLFSVIEAIYRAGEPVDFLTGFQVIIFQLTQTVIQMVEGLPMQVISWEEDGGMTECWKVMTIMIPRIMSNASDDTGIAHLTGA